MDGRTNQLNRTLAAFLLVLASAVVASLVSLDVKVLSNEADDNGMGLEWCALTTATGAIGVVVLGVILLVSRTPLYKDIAKRRYMHARGLMGGVAMTCAFFAVQNTNMVCDARCICCKIAYPV